MTRTDKANCFAWSIALIAGLMVGFLVAHAIYEPEEAWVPTHTTVTTDPVLRADGRTSRRQNLSNVTTLAWKNGNRVFTTRFSVGPYVKKGDTVVVYLHDGKVYARDHSIPFTESLAAGIITGAASTLIIGFILMCLGQEWAFGADRRARERATQTNLAAQKK